jgi:hypothetical protein
MTGWGLSAEETAMITEFRDARAAALAALRGLATSGKPADYEALMAVAERLVASERAMDHDA